ncbi:MAG TPA: hypothetical protein DIU15_11275 [Deltaproteobacteria bacterium]|nr:hypothetical protein [Deltaproteobacteria bacterium]HCP46619.1 hypothetical protein [Deltaproteobacteria bacterium]
MISLDVATDRLLHRVSYRQAFLEERYDELELSEDDLAALQQLDRQQLVETANSVRRSLLERKHRGSGGIRATYPETITAWQEQFDDPALSLFLDRFMESEAFYRYHEVPHAGFGLSLEEATFRFFEDEGVGESAVREREFLAGLCKALALNPQPAFTVGAPVQRGVAGWFAVSRSEPRSLFAAVNGRYVQGALTPFLVDLLTSDQPPEDIAATHGVPDEVVGAALTRFRSLGLLPPPSTA